MGPKQLGWGLSQKLLPVDERYSSNTIEAALFGLNGRGSAWPLRDLKCQGGGHLPRGEGEGDVGRIVEGSDLEEAVSGMQSE